LNTALIGHTGFVGSTLLKQRKFNEYFNTSNIDDIHGKHYDLLICAGVPAEMWIANKYPEKDILNIEKLISNLRKATINNLVLISTNAVYSDPMDVDENTIIDPDKCKPYGKNRLFIEKFVENHFEKYTIIRLPTLFGEGLKKNIVFDLIHNNYLHAAHSRSILQFYNMKDLWRDIEITLNNQIKLINFNSEPIMIKDIAMNCFNMKFDNIPNSEPVFQNIKTLFAPLFGSKNNYMYQSNEIFKGIKEFVSLEK